MSPRRKQADVVEEPQPAVGGVSTDEGGRPVTDDGGRPVRVDGGDDAA